MRRREYLKQVQEQEARAKTVRTQADMLEVVDFLVEKERQQLSNSGE